MALTTGLLGIVDGWLRIKALMGPFLIVGSVIAAVTVDTGQFSMGRVEEVL
jgi:uncharacterized protein (DUF697 family)